ncbi:MAG: carboxypeptidase regulatory-like domain-containing protein [Candidatus Binataceae bacterium]
MKRSSQILNALVLLPPVVLILAFMALPLGCGGGGGAGPTPVPSQGTVQIGLTNSSSTYALASGFQNVLMNITSVRLNPSASLDISESDPNWIAITAPPGVGAIGDLQVDLTQLQGNTKFFNSGVVTAQRYYQVELVINAVDPGTVVPLCGGGSPISEGCIAYLLQLDPAPPTVLRYISPAPITVSPNGVVPVVVDIGAGIPEPAATATSAGSGFSGSSYTYFYSVAPNVTQASSTNNMVTVTGLVTLNAAAGTKKLNSGLTVSAELSGTDTVIETVPVLSASTSPNPCTAGGNGCFTMNLPASSLTGGTAYDFYMSPVASLYYTISNVILTAGNNVTQTFVETSSIKAGTISGVITTKAFGNPLQGVTVDLLATPNAEATPGGPSSVVIGTSYTDGKGSFTFAAVPAGGYSLKISLAGFDTISEPVTVATSSTVTCTSPSPKGTCNYTMTNNPISGTVSIDAPTTHQLSVLIVAEDTGTNNLEGVQMVTIPPGSSGVPFTISVPSGAVPSPVPSPVPTPLKLDLIASTQDSFEGAAPNSNSGHSIAVLSGVSPGQTNVSLETMHCTGHGSISGGVGTVTAPTSGTTVLLSQQDPTTDHWVAIAESSVESVTTGVPGYFTFCEPPPPSGSRPYQVQRLEYGVAQGSPISVGVMNTPVPWAAATPCPICSNASSCPGFCTNTGGVSLP